MDPILKAALSSWGWRVDVILVLALAGTFYTRGWLRLRGRVGEGRPFTRTSYRWPLTARWRPAVYWSGLLVTGIALMSPIDTLAANLFYMHMIQHLLLIMIAPPLLLVANPMPVILWGLPRRARRVAGQGLAYLFKPGGNWRGRLQKATTPGVSWLVWVTITIGWHDPNAYNAALRYEWVHDVEHISFFLGGMLFWWHVTGAGPRLHKQMGPIGRIAYLISAIPPNMIAGIVLAFASAPIYTYYLDVPRLGSMTVMEDQQLGGIIMWVPGSMMYIVAVLILAAQLLQGESQKPALPEEKC
ncbi:MAG: cytochrome c oxidase assembly protein [Anaerolineae bacterium]